MFIEITSLSLHVNTWGNSEHFKHGTVIKKKQFISGKAVFLLAQITEKIQEQEKPSTEKEKLFMETSTNPEVYLEPSITSMLELLANIFGSFQPLTIFEKKSVIDA